MSDVNPLEIPAVAKKMFRDGLVAKINELEIICSKLHDDLSEQIKAADAATNELLISIAALTADKEKLHIIIAGLQIAERKAHATHKAAQDAVEAENRRLQSSLMTLQADYAAREAASTDAFQDAQAGYEATLAALNTEKKELAETIIKMQAAQDTLQNDVDQAVNSFNASLIQQELATCREVAEKCVFIVGFARSNTTITQAILNCADNALVLGEADFFLNHHGNNFTGWYNEQHKHFENQVTKSTYAPSFIPDRPHKWWEWLKEASKFYDCIGEKIALSHYHMGEVRPGAFREFHEARFISSRYIFTLRNPVDVLISSAKLMSVHTDEAMNQLIISWLDFLELWADSVRIFPRTITLVAERFGEGTVAALQRFTGLDLRDAHLLINPANRREHKLSRNFPTLARLQPQLEQIYADVVAAVEENSVLWQAEQKRSIAANDTPGKKTGMIAMTPRPLGRVWLKVNELRDALSQAPDKDKS